jgi:hypothetical protein
MYYGEYNKLFSGTRIQDGSSDLLKLVTIDETGLIACSRGGMIFVGRVYHEMHSRLGTKRIIEKYAVVFKTKLITMNVDYVMDNNTIAPDTLHYYLMEYSHHLTLHSYNDFIVESNGLDMFMASTESSDIFIVQQCIPVLMKCDNPIRLTFKTNRHALHSMTIFIPYTMEIVLFYSTDNVKYVMSSSDTLSTGHKKMGNIKSGIICTVNYEEVATFAFDEEKYLKKCSVKDKTEDFILRTLLMDTSYFQTNAFQFFLHYTKQDVLEYLHIPGITKKMDTYAAKILEVLAIAKPKAIQYYENLAKYNLRDDPGIIVCLLQHDLKIMVEAFNIINLIKSEYCRT